MVALVVMGGGIYSRARVSGTGPLAVCSFSRSLPHVLFINFRLSSGPARSILLVLLFLLFLLCHLSFVACGICGVFDTGFLIYSL